MSRAFRRGQEGNLISIDRVVMPPTAQRYRVPPTLASSKKYEYPHLGNLEAPWTGGLAISYSLSYFVVGSRRTTGTIGCSLAVTTTRVVYDPR